MRRLLFLAVSLVPWVVAGAPTATLAGDFDRIEIPRDPNGAIEFHTPSDNIACGLSESGSDGSGAPELACDRLAPVYLRFILPARGKATILRDVGDQWCCGGYNELPYGREWQSGPFTCDSTASGLTCENQQGHGFFISKAKVKAY
ncbi:hypothetical protein [Mesorhizobium humile]|uniref:Uncharacterized protein n=1 Tax=Mesorhizobium humile TaxID=3072313 RepID=A0ABU4YIZ3_9HYPH|nr:MULTISPECIES: hypothetical protein [unclassified Mesorhizobium]MDX8461114.1 hypothetical protein [Mesorhizobium sp. VK2D]MDX8486913.1 hypothetical protein [Mesorhizobium sp. VK2B]